MKKKKRKGKGKKFDARYREKLRAREITWQTLG
jgi:hypothetical protein